MDGKEFTVSEVIDSFGINGHTWLMFVLLESISLEECTSFLLQHLAPERLALSILHP